MKHPTTAKRLRDAMSEAGLSAKELSDITGVSQASLSQYMNGSHKPSNESAAKIAIALNVNYLWLLGYDVSQRIRDVSEIAIPPETIKKIEYISREMSKLTPEEQALLITHVESMLDLLRKKED